MTKNIQTEKLNAAIDMLIESDADLSTVLGKEGLIYTGLKKSDNKMAIFDFVRLNNEKWDELVVQNEKLLQKHKDVLVKFEIANDN